MNVKKHSIFTVFAALHMEQLLRCCSVQLACKKLYKLNYMYKLLSYNTTTNNKMDNS